MLRYRIIGHNFDKLNFGVFNPLLNFKISRHILITKKHQKSVRLMIPSDLRSPYPIIPFQSFLKAEKEMRVEMQRFIVTFSPLLLLFFGIKRLSHIFYIFYKYKQ